jgi:hypothetical protein
MERMLQGRSRFAALVAALLAAMALAACGSSGSTGQAQSLLRQTFSGGHSVKSGVITFSLSLDPTGSSTIKTPISLGLSGPFQTRGTGNLPASNFQISIDALGHHGQLGIVSTGTNGYFVLDGDAYQLPAADYQKLVSSFASAGSGTGGLAKLGINPLHWVSDPQVVGTESMGGASTTHIHAHVNVNALLGDLNTFLQKASSTGATGSKIPASISASTRQLIVSSVKNPTVDVWTGASDKTLRKLDLNLNYPISGQYSTALGGMSSAGINLTLAYANLNQPQTISTPTNVKPYSGFQTRLKAIVQQIESTFGSGGSASGASSGGTGTGTTTGSSGGLSKYSQCIAQANGNVTKMQKCAALINGG